MKFSRSSTVEILSNGLWGRKMLLCPGVKRLLEACITPIYCTTLPLPKFLPDYFTIPTPPTAPVLPHPPVTSVLMLMDSSTSPLMPVLCLRAEITTTRNVQTIHLPSPISENCNPWSQCLHLRQENTCSWPSNFTLANWPLNQVSLTNTGCRSAFLLRILLRILFDHGNLLVHSILFLWQNAASCQWFTA